MTDYADIKCAFLSAAYGKLTPHLLEYSASLDGSQLQARIVVLDAIGEEEEDIIYDILGDIVGSVGGKADFELVRVSTASEADENPSLPILLFRAYSLNSAG